MNTHTAGPWYAGKVGNIHDQGLISSETTGASIAVTYDAKDTALIAAAPELLAALETLTEWMREHTGPSDGTLKMLYEAQRIIGAAQGY